MNKYNFNLLALSTFSVLGNEALVKIKVDCTLQEPFSIFLGEIAETAIF